MNSKINLKKKKTNNKSEKNIINSNKNSPFKNFHEEIISPKNIQSKEKQRKLCKDSIFWEDSNIFHLSQNKSCKMIQNPQQSKIYLKYNYLIDEFSKKKEHKTSGIVNFQKLYYNYFYKNKVKSIVQLPKECTFSPNLELTLKKQKRKDNKSQISDHNENYNNNHSSLLFKNSNNIRVYAKITENEKNGKKEEEEKLMNKKTSKFINKSNGDIYDKEYPFKPQLTYISNYQYNKLFNEKYNASRKPENQNFILRLLQGREKRDRSFDRNNTDLIVDIKKNSHYSGKIWNVSQKQMKKIKSVLHNKLKGTK